MPQNQMALTIETQCHSCLIWLAIKDIDYLNDLVEFDDDRLNR